LEDEPASPLFDDPSLTPAGGTCEWILLNYNLLPSVKALRN